MKREELEVVTLDEIAQDLIEDQVQPDEYYVKEEANNVMDDLEANVNNLNKANAELIKRVQELEDENNKLEAENEQLKDKK